MSDKPYYVHPLALVESDLIGSGTRIWAFAHVQQGARIGSGCNIGDHSFIESNVVIGDDVTVKNGVSIWDGVTIENRVFIGPNACFTNDLRPRSKVYHEAVSTTLIHEGASIGANATIVADIEIGRYAMVAAGSVVTRSVLDYEIVVGVPARHHGWISRAGNDLHFVDGIALDGKDSYRIDEGRVSFIE